MVLIGASGAGKSTFAGHHFKESQVISSDACRRLISDDENDQSATSQAFGLVHFIAVRRLARGRLTVIDATNLRRSDRQAFLGLARKFGRPAVAILFDVPLEACLERNQGRPGRQVGDGAVRAQHSLLPRAEALTEEGFEIVHRIPA